MIYMFAALQRLAEQRGDGLLPELADRLQKMPRGGPLITIDGDTGDRSGEKDVDRSKEPRKEKRA
jgi:hypothetical protein